MSFSPKRAKLTAVGRIDAALSGLWEIDFIASQGALPVGFYMRSRWGQLNPSGKMKMQLGKNDAVE